MYVYPSTMVYTKEKLVHKLMGVVTATMLVMNPILRRVGILLGELVVVVVVMEVVIVHVLRRDLPPPEPVFAGEAGRWEAGDAGQGWGQWWCRWNGDGRGGAGEALCPGSGTGGMADCPGPAPRPPLQRPPGSTAQRWPGSFLPPSSGCSCRSTAPSALYASCALLGMLNSILEHLLQRSAAGFRKSRRLRLDLAASVVSSLVPFSLFSSHHRFSPPLHMLSPPWQHVVRIQTRRRG